MFFLAVSYGISTTLRQILISPRFPIHSSNGFHWCSRKKLFELSDAFGHWCFEKITTAKIFTSFPAKQPWWSSFSVHSQTFPGFFQKALQGSYSVENLLAPVLIKRNSTAYVISGIFQNFKNTQGKARGCNLKKLHNRAFPGHFPKFS